MKGFPVVAQLNAASLVTSASVLLAVSGCQFASAGQLGWAVLCGALTIPCDVLDGVLARKLNQVTAFGGALDSLADALAFCLAPAMLARGMGVGGAWLPVLWLYPLAGLWRLARFAQVGTTVVNGRECFQGWPTTFAAALFYLVAAVAAGVPPAWRGPLLGGYLAAAAVAMNGGFAFPKRGLHTKVLWALVPVAVVASAVRWW